MERIWPRNISLSKLLKPCDGTSSSYENFVAARRINSIRTNPISGLANLRGYSEAVSTEPMTYFVLTLIFCLDTSLDESNPPNVKSRVVM